jgi:hypothetical protein
MLHPEVTAAQAGGYGLECADPRDFLNTTDVYEVSGVDLRRWDTGIHLYGIEGRFNATCFYPVTACPTTVPTQTKQRKEDS